MAHPPPYDPYYLAQPIHENYIYGPIPAAVGTNDRNGGINTLFVSGLPDDVKPREIHNLFRHRPGFESCQLKYTGRGNQVVAFATFVNHQSAMAALHSLNGVKFDPQTGSNLHIELARSISRRKNKPGSGPYVVIDNRTKSSTDAHETSSDDGESDDPSKPNNLDSGEKDDSVVEKSEAAADADNFVATESMASKHIIADLNKGEKFNGDNFDIWHRKIQYVLEKQEVLEALTSEMAQPEEGTAAQHRRDREAYDSWKKKNSTARITLLSSMENDLMCEYELHTTANALWMALNQKFGKTSPTRLRCLTLKFDSYKKLPDHSMKKHLRVMSGMIRELKEAGSKLSDEQQIQAVIRSIPDNWEHMRMNLTHNDGIKTFSDIAHHLELEEERLVAVKSPSVLVAESSSRKAFRPKRKRTGGASKKGNAESGPTKKAKHKRGKRAGSKKDKNKMTCHNCDQLGHFARECTEPKKTQEQSTT